VFLSVGSKSASIGVATFHPGETVIETINRAAAALYQAKHCGRNQVACGEPGRETAGMRVRGHPAISSPTGAKAVSSSP